MKALILHGDLDGLTSGAVLYNILYNTGFRQLIVLISQPFSLHRTLEKIFYRKNLTEIFLIDISVDIFSWYKIRQYLKELASKAKITWIDHHKSTLYKVRELTDIGVKIIYENDGCTATIMRKIYVERTDNILFFKKITIIGEISDKVFKGVPEDHLIKLTNMLSSVLALKTRDDKFKIDLVKKWAIEKRYIDDYIKEEAFIARKKLKELSNIVKNHIIFSSDNIMIIDFSNISLKGFTGKIALDLSNRYKKIVVIIFTPNRRETVFTCRVPDEGYENINAAEIFYKIAEKIGGGSGGHKKAASLRLPTIKRGYALKAMLFLFNKFLKNYQY